MQFALFDESHAREVIELFVDVFSESENAAEGEVIGNLVAGLITSTAPEDLIGFVAIAHDAIVGCIFFSRFDVPRGERAFILSPVAVATGLQGAGIGQGLIRYGIARLREQDVSLVLTYGDPAYYSRVGFIQISEEVVPAPFQLSQPEGWLAQPLDGQPLVPMQGITGCVKALSDQKYW